MEATGGRVVDSSQGGMLGEIQSRLSGAVSGTVQEVPRGWGERGLVRAARFDGDGGVAGGREIIERAGNQHVPSTGGRGRPPFIVEKVSNSNLLEKCLLC